MSQLKSYEMITKFTYGDNPPKQEQAADYRHYISDLWPVIRKCREVAQVNQEKMIVDWMQLVRELYMVPEDLTGLYQSVLQFINNYNSNCHDQINGNR
jgi:hypothetical protein